MAINSSQFPKRRKYKTTPLSKFRKKKNTTRRKKK